MPQIIFEHIEHDKLDKSASILAEKLAEAIKCPAEWVSITWLPTESFNHHYTTPQFPIINVNWFPRSKEIQDAVAKVIYDLVHSLGYKRLQIYFHAIDKSDYYEFT